MCACVHSGVYVARARACVRVSVEARPRGREAAHLRTGRRVLPEGIVHPRGILLLLRTRAGRKG
eukprot:scaffold676_cov115-Isochrysis_galbana.AAC.15